MSEMEYNGVKLELDLLDADEMERYENALADTRTLISDQSQYEGKKNSEQMRIQISIIDDFFDNLFGKGTSGRMFGKNADLRKRIDAFGMAANLGAQLTAEVNALKEKYNPERLPNREQRRKKKYNNRTRKWQ